MAHVRRNSESRKFDSTILEDRRSSFHDNAVRWPASLPSADSMADAGFYFTPNDKYQDCTTCFRCGVKMFNWLPDDTPKSEHKKFSPSCREVKSWIGVVVETNRAINRADQVDSRLRNKLADKAKKLTLPFHRKRSDSDPSRESTSADSQSFPQSQTQESLDRPLNEEEKLADVRRQREVAEKSLDGLQKLASFYPIGSQEQKRAEQSIVLQVADLEKIRLEEDRLLSSMGALSFGRGWRDVTSDSPKIAQHSSHNSQVNSDTVFSDEDSPEVARGRASLRPLPQLPSQLRNTGPRQPAKLTRTQSVDQTSYDASYSSSSSSSSPSVKSEWIEYFTEDGTPYYFSTITQKTVWTIPTDGSSPVA